MSLVKKNTIFITSAILAIITLVSIVSADDDDKGDIIILGGGFGEGLGGGGNQGREGVHNSFFRGKQDMFGHCW